MAPLRTRPPLLISLPQDFRQVSSVIDVDLLPETHRRVRLHKHGSDRPLGFYIRDGMSVRVAPQGLERVPGIFISRLVRGGLAERKKVSICGLKSILVNFFGEKCNFCLPSSKYRPEAKLKNFELIVLGEEISRQPSVDSLLW